MAKQIIEARVKQKVDTESNWLNNELRLLDGEQAFVRTDAGVSVNFKIGDGNKTFSELPYFYPPLTLGSISTTQTLSQLNALADGVWVARGSGTFAFGLTAEEGYFTTFRKVGTQWTLNSRTEVLFTAPNIDWIEDQLENHEQRITWNEALIREQGGYIQGLANNFNVLDNTVRNLDENQIKIVGLYPDLENPTAQSSFNRRLFNYVKNSLDTSTNFKTNTFNNVTEQFGFGTSSFKFGQRSDGTAYIDSLGTRNSFKKDAFRVGKDDDNYMELNYDVLIGRTNGVAWGIKKDRTQTRASNLQMPMTGSTFRTAVISVNGEYADENGNVVFSGGGGGSEYVLPIASAARLGGVRVGSGLTIGFDGTLNAVASSNIYTSNGTLTDNRTVDLNNKTITFTNGGFKADKLTLPLMLENTTPLTIWADRNGKLKYTNKDGVTSDIGATGGGGGGASYIAGLGITIDRNEISAKVDGTTISTNASGQLVAVGGDENIYNTNGTLTSARTVNLGNYTLNFTNGILKSSKYTLDVLSSNLTPNTTWTDGNDLFFTNNSGVSKKVGGVNVVNAPFNPPTLAQLESTGIRAGDIYNCTATNQRAFFDGVQITSWNLTQAIYNSLTTEQKNAVKLFNIIIE